MPHSSEPKLNPISDQTQKWGEGIKQMNTLITLLIKANES